MIGNSDRISYRNNATTLAEIQNAVRIFNQLYLSDRAQTIKLAHLKHYMDYATSRTLTCCNPTSSLLNLRSHRMLQSKSNIHMMQHVEQSHAAIQLPVCYIYIHIDPAKDSIGPKGCKGRPDIDIDIVHWQATTTTTAQDWQMWRRSFCPTAYF